MFVSRDLWTCLSYFARHGAVYPQILCWPVIASTARLAPIPITCAHVTRAMSTRLFQDAFLYRVRSPAIESATVPIGPTSGDPAWHVPYHTAICLSYVCISQELRTWPQSSFTVCCELRHYPWFGLLHGQISVKIKSPILLHLAPH